MAKRWTVRTPEGEDIDVGAETVQIVSGGALAFYKDNRILVAYAPTAWKDVSFDYDEDSDGE